jgi:hypothetical protein
MKKIDSDSLSAFAAPHDAITSGICIMMRDGYLIYVGPISNSPDPDDRTHMLLNPKDFDMLIRKAILLPSKKVH